MNKSGQASSVGYAKVSSPNGSPARRGKIVGLDELATIRQRYMDKRIVLCHGAFDLVHIGHILHFEEAREQGDLLVVTLTADHCIKKKRPIAFQEEHRARQVAALEIVDFVAIVNEPSAYSAIQILHPDVYVKGSEYSSLIGDKTANISREKELIESYGGHVFFTAAEAFSSTKLAHFLLVSSEATQDNPLLRNDRVLFRDLHNFEFKREQLNEFLRRAADLKVCLLGETIIDEWVDVAVSALSQKSRCLAGREGKRIRQIGGAGIVALHLASFVKEVHCFTNGLTGDLPDNVSVTQLADQPIVKTRFVDRDLGYPLFEAKQLELGTVRHDRLPDFDDYDLVLIADFGHDLLDVQEINSRMEAGPRSFMAAMAQVNSSNYGYNLPMKYVGADYYSLNRTEAELCLHEKGLAPAELAERMASLLQCRLISVTNGDQGAIVKMGNESFALPSLSTTVVDTIGCGDAYFALSSIAACLGMPAKMVALAGSIGAGAMAQRRCNASPISEHEFLTIGEIVI
jgi:rfaE bifunctional protein nucleotidyltransferase chain/domain